MSTLSKLFARIAAVSLTIPLSLPALAVVDTFLKVPGAPGESTSIAHPREIEVLSWSWGATNLGKDGVLFAPFTWTQQLDSAFVPLFLGLTSDKRFDSVELSVSRVAGGPRKDFFKMTLSDAHVLSLSSAGSFDGIIVTGSMSYSAIAMSYCPTLPTGDLGRCIAGSFTPTPTGAMAFAGDAQVLRGMVEAGGQVAFAVTTVPEPSALSGALAGMAVLGGLAWRRRAKGGQEGGLDLA